MIEAPTLPPGTRVNDVEARLQVIEDVEAVKKAMFRYYRCLDFKLFDELGDCFTQDVTADYGMPGWGAEGREALVDFLAANESREDYRVSHSSHNEEVEIVDATTARGYFKLHDWVVMSGVTMMRGFGLYDMGFEKSNRWRIKTLKLHYVYREEHHVHIDNVATPSLTPALRSEK
jgi:SnoaL-like domain